MEWIIHSTFLESRYAINLHKEIGVYFLVLCVRLYAKLFDAHNICEADKVYVLDFEFLILRTEAGRPWYKYTVLLSYSLMFNIKVSFLLIQLHVLYLIFYIEARKARWRSAQRACVW